MFTQTVHNSLNTQADVIIMAAVVASSPLPGSLLNVASPPGAPLRLAAAAPVFDGAALAAEHMTPQANADQVVGAGIGGHGISRVLNFDNV